MNKNNIISILFTLIIFLSVIIPPQNIVESNVSNNNDFSKTSETSPINYIMGNSFLNITDQILINSGFNASWYSEISILESYGTDLLPNQSNGIRNQIDEYMGNNDSFLDSTEINNFTQLILSSRNWTNSAIGGCCEFDYIPFTALENEIIINAPLPGLVNQTDSIWGWIESANLTGLTDNRITRILDLPRVGSLIEEVPLHISLPENWEFRYSAMSQIIDGEPNNFVVNRSNSPVASNIRITIGENFPPSLSASRYPESSLISLNGSTTYTSFCEDSVLENPITEWKIVNNNQLIDTIQNPWFQLNPIDYDFKHGEAITIIVSCTDSHGINTSWSENIIIDGIMPEWSGEISSNIENNFQILDVNSDILSVISGSEIMINITSNDESQLPTSIEILTNISDGWRQYQTNEGTFSFIVSQGSGINGLHLSITERHQVKQPTELGMLLIVTDDAGNSVSKEWKIEVTDGNAPTILMDIMANNSLIDLDDSAREGDNVKLVFSNSYDDLDSINNTTWEVYLNDYILLETSYWSEKVEKLLLPPIKVGNHEITVIVNDSSGNSKTEIFPLSIFPKRGVDLEVISQSLTGDLSEGGIAVYVLQMKNNGFDDTYARVCIEDTCNRFVFLPGAELESTTISILEYDLTMPEESNITIRIEWDSISANDNGNFFLEYNIESEDDHKSLFIFPVLILIIVAIFISRSIGLAGKSN